MSHSRKHLKNAHLNSYPEPSDNEEVALVVDLKGANMCDIELSSGATSIAVIPSRFRKLIWIKKGITSSSDVNVNRKLPHRKGPHRL